MDCKVYYRSPFMNRSSNIEQHLHQIDVSDVDCPEKAVAEVIRSLEADKSVFYMPVLALLQGGKA